MQALYRLCSAPISSESPFTSGCFVSAFKIGTVPGTRLGSVRTTFEFPYRYRYSYAYLTDQITHTSVLVELKLHEVLSTASRPHRCPLSTTSTLYSFIAYRLTELDQVRGCDSTEDLGIDDCSTHPSLPTADCLSGWRFDWWRFWSAICNLKSEIRFFLKSAMSQAIQWIDDPIQYNPIDQRSMIDLRPKIRAYSYQLSTEHSSFNICRSLYRYL